MEKINFSESTKQKLDPMYLVIYAIKNEVNIKKGDYIEKTDIYSLVGIDSKGKRQFLNIYQDKTNNNRYWLDCFEVLKSRGIQQVLFLSVDNNKNFKRTAKIAFPDVVFIDSLTDIIPKFYKYSSNKSAKEIYSRLHSLYVQKTLSDFKIEFKSFCDTYNNSIHQKLIQKYLNNIEGIYKYSYNIRVLLFKHSANIVLYNKIRVLIDNSNYILDLEEICDKLGNIDKYFGFTSFKKSEWIYIINDLIQMFPKFDFI